MTDDEFTDWLAAEVAGSRMTQEQMKDLLSQKLLFVINFGREDDPRRSDFRLHIVGYVADKLRVHTDIHALLDAAKREFPDRMIYFEPIGFDLF